MSFEQQKANYEALKGTEHLETDMELLAKILPESPWLKRKLVDHATHHDAVLWALCKTCTRQQIEDNRKPPIDFQRIADDTAKIIAVLPGSESEKVANELMDQLVEVIKPLSESERIEILKQATDAFPDFAAIAKQNVINSLLATDLETVSQSVLAKFIRDLGITAINMKANTIRPILIQFKLNLPKEDPGSGEKMEGVNAVPNGSIYELIVEGSKPASHSDQVIDIMNADPDAKKELDDADPEKEELQTKVEELEEENSDLQDQLEEKELENEELLERIEAAGTISEEQRQQIIANFFKEKQTADPADKTGAEPGAEKKNQ